MKNNTVVSIIGGGASGFSVAYALLEGLVAQNTPQLVRIVIFEKGDELGTGLAYSIKQSKTNLNNTQNKMIGLTLKDREEFFRWLKANQEKWVVDYPHLVEPILEDFYPRQLIGQFLKDKAQDLQELAKKHNVSLSIVNKEVVDVDIINGDQWLITKDKFKFPTDFIILCTGNEENQNFIELKEHKNYFQSFYQCEQQIKEQIPNVKSILVIGTRLGAVDAIIFLKHHQYQGHMSLASRDGIIPLVRDEYKVYELKYFNRKHLQDLMKSGTRLSLKLFIDHLEKTLSEEIYNKEIKLDEMIKDPQNYKYEENLRNEVNRVKKGDSPWQKLQASLLDVFEFYWQNFTTEEKILSKQYMSHVLRYINSMPLKNAEKVLELLESKQLDIQYGLQDLQYDEKENKFIAHFLQNHHEFKNSYDMVINASGLNILLPTSQDIYRNLSEKELVNFSDIGSLDVDPKFKVRSSKKGFDKIYAIGQPSFGNFALVNFMMAIAKQANIVAQDVISRSKHIVQSQGIYKL